MKVARVLFFLFLFTISIYGTEVNFNFASMIPSNSVSCDVATCPPSADEQLQSEIIGDVVSLSSDPDVYDEMIAVWNAPRGTSSYIPTLIVAPITEDDVVTAINYARENNLEVSIKNGGHSPDGLSLTQRGLQINFQKMKSVVIDASAKIALVGAGCTNTDVNNAGRPFNLAHVGGDVGSIGFSGATGVAAYGALSRQAGLGVDNVISVKIVTWEGKVLNVSQETDSELFWAVRGSLANFGVAVSWQIKLHDVSFWYGGSIIYPPESISSVLNWAHQYVDMEYFHFRGIYFPGDKIFWTQWGHWDPRFRTTEKDAFFESLQSAAPFMVWTVGSQDYYTAQSDSDPIVAATPRNIQRAFGAGGGVVNPTTQFFDKFQEVCMGFESPNGDLRFELWGGNISSVHPSATAFWSRTSQYLWTVEPYWYFPGDDQTYQEKALDAYKILRAFPEATDDCYPNYVSPDFAEICYGNNINRLKDLKKTYDPNNFFHRNYNIKP